jgi:hypothetical protein
MSRAKTPGYHEYLRSDAWRQRRAPVLAAAKGICLGCGRRAEGVHHRSYERLGHEADVDLVAVCWDCHRDIHLYHVEHADMGLWAATNALITERRALFGLAPVKLPSERAVRRSARPVSPKAARRRERQKQSDTIPVNSPARMEIRSVRCPKCGAHAGELCRSSSGNPRPANHQRRVDERQRQSRGEAPSRVRSPNRRFKRGGRHRPGGAHRLRLNRDSM